MVAAPFIAGLVAFTLLAWLCFGRQYRQRSRRSRLRTGAVALALTATLAADSMNSYYSFLPNVSDVIDAASMNAPAHYGAGHPQRPLMPPTRGRLVRLGIPDRGSGFGRSDAWTWLPSVYFTDPSIRLPVVYLFHGSPGQPKDWFHGGDAARIAAALPVAVILVAPKMSKNWLDDPECVDGLHENVESHLLRDVIPTVDSELRTEATREGRIFAGMSAGGFCALNLGLRNRTTVAKVLDFSGETVPTHSGGVKALFGSDHARAVQNSPAIYAPSLTQRPPMRIWLDCGAADRTVLGQLRRIVPALKADGMTVELHVRPGGHSYSVWRPALDASLRWALAGDTA